MYILLSTIAQYTTHTKHYCIISDKEHCLVFYLDYGYHCKVQYKNKHMYNILIPYLIEPERS